MIVRHRTAVARPAFAPRTLTFAPLAVDRTFEQLTASLRDPRRRTPVVDTTWRDGTLTLSVDLPGVPAEAVEVEVTGRTLRLGVRTEELTWTRSLTLPASLDPDSVAARHVDGRLTVTVAPVATPPARRIAVETAPASAAAIDTASSDAGEADHSGEAEQA